MAKSSNKVVKLVSLNCYLIPWLFTFKQGSRNSRYDQYDRAQSIGEFIKSFDLITLQEVWGSQMGVLQRSVPNHKLIPGYESTKIMPITFLENLFNSMYSYYQHYGGLWSAHSSSFPLLYHSRITFTVSETSSKKGVQCFLLDMNSHWPNKKLLVFNTHLDPMNRQNQQEQIRQIAKFMQSTLEALANSEGLSDCGVILNGDFNSGADSTNYKFLLKTIGARDLYREYCIKHKVCEENSFSSDENQMIEWNGCNERIDFVLAIDSFHGIEFLKLKAEEFEIVKQEKGKELSDHFPLVVHLLPNQ